MKKIISLALALVFVFALSSCSSGAPENTVSSPSDLAGKTVGVLADSASEGYLAESSPLVYDDAETMLSDLLSGRLDAIATDRSTAAELIRHKGAKILKEPLVTESYCIMTALENPELTKDVNSAISALESDMTLETIISACISGAPYPDFTAPEDAESLTVAVDSSFPPYCTADENGVLTGLDAAAAEAICSYLGLRAEFIDVPRDKLASAVQTGRAALALGRISDGDAESVCFSEPYMETEQVLIVRK